MFYPFRYIYTERVDLKSFDQACELSYAANKYVVSDLLEKCLHFMGKDLIPENVYRALKYANLYKDTTLKVLWNIQLQNHQYSFEWTLFLQEQSLNFIRRRTREFLSHPEFENITESTLVMLVKEDDLNISEIDLFEAVKRWGSKECARREIDVNGPNLRQVFEHLKRITCQIFP